MKRKFKTSRSLKGDLQRKEFWNLKIAKHGVYKLLPYEGFLVAKNNRSLKPKK
jgi:hypothetical protein